MSPSCLVLDESFSALDQNTEDKVLHNMLHLRDVGTLSSIILVTHDSEKYIEHATAQITVNSGRVDYNETEIA